MQNIYDEIKKRVRNLDDIDFSIEYLNNVKAISNDFKNACLSSTAPSSKMMAEPLLELFNHVLYDFVLANKLQLANEKLSTKVVDRIVDGIKMAKLDIKDIITCNDYAFIIGENIDNFSHNLVPYNSNSDLVEITSVEFTEFKDKKNCSYFDLLNLLRRILASINSVLDINSLMKGENVPKLFMQDNKVLYSLPNFHLYLNKNLVSILTDLMNNKTSTVDIIVLDNYENYYALELHVTNTSIDVIDKETEIWKLSDKKKNALQKQKVAKDE